MKILSIGLFLAISGSAHASCPEMGDAAQALAKINGATFASPTYRLLPRPVMTEQGAEYKYSYDAFYSRGDEEPSVTVGRIVVKALIRTGTEKCQVLSLIYTPK